MSAQKNEEKNVSAVLMPNNVAVSTTAVAPVIKGLIIKKKTNNYSVRNAEFTAFLTKLSCMQ